MSRDTIFHLWLRAVFNRSTSDITR